jgi:amino acid transporter
MSEAAVEFYDEEAESGGLKREIGWTHAVWVATGAPALVLFSIGAIAATVGSPSWLVWVASVLIGGVQMFTYAEVSAMFTHKSGGMAISGSMAWLKYGKIFPAISAWCYWLAWTPVIAIGTGIASGYIFSALFPANSPVNTWQIVLVNLGWLQSGLTLRINASFFLGVALILVCFFIQSKGIMRIARMQMIFAIASLVPLGLIGIVPLITGDAPAAHFLPFAPLSHDSAGNVIPGSWNMAGITLFSAGLFIAAWSTYGIETCLVYTREFRNPSTDTVKAALGTTLVCLFFYAIVPISFQGALGLAGMLAPGIYDGSGVGLAMAQMVGFKGIGVEIIIIMLLITLLLAVMTAIAGSARTLFQSSTDGFLPKYLSTTNKNGTPIKAMFTDLGLNIVLLSMSNDVFLLAVSNVCYLTFIFMNLQSGWIHRMDRPGWTRPYKAPTWLLALGAAFGFFDMFLIGIGAQAYGNGVLVGGFITVFLILPVFAFRHYVVDKGKFPAAFSADVQPGGPVSTVTFRAGIWPYVAIAGAVAAVALGNLVAVY